MGRALMIVGLAVFFVGLVLTLLPNTRLGRLPGDIVIRRDNWSVFIPIATSILLSVFLTLLLWIISWIRR
ncbi:MAG: DUF2905 domain-containing protein [Acidobacteria bacterium]|nr:MAG: DUF2905 domain-containing protein [Acidobacteriota bacterium]